ncbi:orotate phosphoribosyltransferase [Halomarina ordinaria]|uniref:Orotate phosphoribosyltransferase n=1 Tax=Halomarina ordinaria TaxID=3033939 RepID=A0ABD5UBN7_9EURY|nr:orotate phosphoribosyltransferase [Halomarina sp. PSRA2]
MNYRSLSDLNAAARELATELPDSIDLIVGIPRSGLLAANLLCLYRNQPMTDVDGLCDGRIMRSGYRYDGHREFEHVDHVLVVDDSVDTGRQMQETKSRLDEHDFPFEVSYAALYVSTHGHRHVDYWSEVVSKPRFFEWNLLHHPMLKNSCVDIDGVLCRDPTPEENDDGKNYREFIRTVDPEIVPTERVGWLVTCRLERYREDTERWLDEHGVEYDELVMMDLPSKAAREEREDHAAFKAEVYERTGATLFVESSPGQATEIAERTGKPVFCYEANQLVSPGTVARVQTKGNEYLSRFASDPVAFSMRAGQHVLSKGTDVMSLLSHRYRDD